MHNDLELVNLQKFESYYLYRSEATSHWCILYHFLLLLTSLAIIFKVSLAVNISSLSDKADSNDTHGWNENEDDMACEKEMALFF